MTRTVLALALLPAALCAQYVGNVTGVVKDAGTRRPVANAVVVVSGEDEFVGRTDRLGRFLISGVPVEYPASRYSIAVSAPRYQTQVLRDVNVLPGAVMALECVFALASPGPARGIAPAAATFAYSHERPARASGRLRGGQIFATREGLVGRTTANGHVIRSSDRFVALPSRRALNRRGERTYQVRVSYRGRSATVPVWDIGPWNIKDDYWNPPSDKESWRSLPRGLPQAQAAYLNGYNAGRDGFGRRVRNPAGIDLSDAVFRNDLRMPDNDWVSVEYLRDPTLISSRGPASRAPSRRRPSPGPRPPRTLPEIIALAEAILLKTSW
ncbi:MAG: carboxypeptidase-like regulatory domain-containing protein [Bryobacteraceae bacterium]|nr:carboxypeptidase-like regulatory domain-containing protein [Bryobacteraceae bacterium]